MHEVGHESIKPPRRVYRTSRGYFVYGGREYRVGEELKMSVAYAGAEDEIPKALQKVKEHELKFKLPEID